MHHTDAAAPLGRALSVRSVCVLLAILLFAALCVVPSLYMLLAAVFSPEGTLTLERYRVVLLDARQLVLLRNTTLIGVGTAIVSALIGAPLGLALARLRLPYRNVLRLLLLAPVVVPPYVFALAWVLLSGPVGIVGQHWRGGSEWTYSLPAVVAVLGINLYPVAMLATEAAARRVDRKLEEAGLLVAGPTTVLRSITLPLTAPVVGAAALIAFVLAIAEFSVPALLRVRVYTTEVFTAFAALYDFGRATALALPLLVVAVVAALLVRLLLRGEFVAGRRGLGSAHDLLPRTWQAPVLMFMVAVSTLGMVAPLLALAVTAGRWWRGIAAARASVQAIGNSLVLAALAATGMVFVGVVLGHAHARLRIRTLIPELLLVVLFAIPSTVVGVGLIGVWNHAGIDVVYATRWMIVIGYAARLLPLAVLFCAAAARQLPVSYEEAADVAGIPWPSLMARIVVPQLGPALVVTWVMIFIFCFGELGTTILISPPGESTLPVRMYTLIANAPPHDVAALALVQVSVILSALVGLLIAQHSWRAAWKRSA